MARQLLGRRPLSLQWISWDHFGEVEVKDRGGFYTMRGEQRGVAGDEGANDYVRLDGVIREIDEARFVFDGKIETRVYHLNGGVPYIREGRQGFGLYGGRRFWRMESMDNPDQAVDYIDVYFDMAAAKAPSSDGL